MPGAPFHVHGLSHSRFGTETERSQARSRRGELTFERSLLILSLYLFQPQLEIIDLLLNPLGEDIPARHRAFNAHGRSPAFLPSFLPVCLPIWYLIALFPGKFGTYGPG